VPRTHEMRACRGRALQMMAKAGLEPDANRDMLDDAEVICQLQIAIRNTSAPYEPLVGTPEELERTYDRPSLEHAYARLDALRDLIDPRPQDVSADELFAVIAAIAKNRTIAPLAALGSRSRAHCVITMAEMLATSLELSSSPAPSAPSTPEPSANSSSPPS